MSVSRQCAVCADWVGPRAVVRVEPDEVASGPVLPVWACWGCVTQLGLRTISPETSPASFIGRRALPPILPAPAPGSTV